jgi:hypothetical protein
MTINYYLLVLTTAMIASRSLQHMQEACAKKLFSISRWTCSEMTGMLFLTWDGLAVLVTVDQMICFQVFEQLLFKLFTAVFALLLHLVTNNILFNTSKLSKQMELDHHDLHDSNKETQSDYFGGGGVWRGSYCKNRLTVVRKVANMTA